MSQHLTFMMGRFAAEFPTDRLYASNHMWALPRGERYRFGFSAYAVRLLQDVYFLDWVVEPGAPLRQRQEIGAIERKKAMSSLWAPIGGELCSLNESLLDDPSAINADKYGAGWLFEIRGPGDDLLSPQQYLRHLDDVWAVTQKTIKDQLNEP
jgi:glycine cleavage system H protein